MATKILYAEDELFLGKIVRESLQSRGFEVLMESDGARVFPAFQQFNPDICVLDIMMPNKDGFEVAEAIRGVDPQVPLLFLTAKTQTADVVRGFTLGGNDYLRKPFSMEELIVRIENLLRTPGNKPATPEILNLGRYQFQLNRQVLVLEGQEKKLSYRESELLKILYENREGIIDRKEILQLLWGNDSFFNSRTLDVYVTKLRSYLKEDPRLEIMTIKGIGYRFVM